MRRHIRFVLALAPVLALLPTTLTTSASAVGVPSDARRPGASAEGDQAVCDASKYEHLVGKPFRNDGQLPKVHRIYHRYTPLSKECRLDRLNVELTALAPGDPEGYEGRVTDVWCG